MLQIPFLIICKCLLQGIIKNKNGQVPFENESYIEAGRIIAKEGIPSAVDALAIVKYATGKYSINQSK